MKTKPTLDQYIDWLVSLPPLNANSSPSLTYTMGAAEEFGCSIRHINKLYDQIVGRVVMRSKEVLGSTAHQWDGVCQMSGAVPEQVIWWERKDK